MVNMKNNLRLCIVLLALTIVLVACQPPRIKTSSTIRIEFTAEGFTQSAYHVIAGQTISLTIVNTTPNDHHLLILMDIPGKDQSIPSRNILFRAQIPAQSTLSASFKAPLAAGEYFIICNLPDHLENGERGKVVVVHPEFAD